MSAELISNWITEQLEGGKTDEQLDGTIFYNGTTSHIIKKSRRQGKFDLRTTFGNAVNLNELKGEING